MLECFQREKIKHVREAVPVTEVGSQCRLTFKMPGISADDLDATVLAPSGKVHTFSNRGGNRSKKRI